MSAHLFKCSRRKPAPEPHYQPQVLLWQLLHPHRVDGEGRRSYGAWNYRDGTRAALCGYSADQACGINESYIRRVGIKFITFVETVDLRIHWYVHQHYTGHAEG